MESHIQCVAHRGGAALAPENTLAAFRNALTLPAVDAIELDVHMSRDGRVIVFHDNSVEKLTNGIGNILDLDFAYLRSLNAAAHFPGGWHELEQIPTLREVLELARGRVPVYIEIKRSKRDDVFGFYSGIVEAVVNEVRAVDLLHQTLIISFGWLMVQSVKSLDPTLQTGALVSDGQWNPHEKTLDTLVGEVKATGCDWINVVHHLYTDNMPDVAHSNGFKLGVWAANTEDELRRLAAAGVDSLISDRPDLFARL